MTKRLVLSMALILCTVAVSVADVQIKKLDDTNVEITFTYKDDAASEVGVIGSFDNWTVPGEAMSKNKAGLWEYKLKALVTDELQYKFYNKGTWIFDFKAPDKKDDGFGGNNGLIVVADVLAGAVAGGGKPGAGKVAGDPYAAKLNFGMFTYFGSKSSFVTQGLVDKTKKGLETDTTGLMGKSYWKIGGTLMPGVTAWFEMKAFDSYQAVWAQDSTGKVSPELPAGLSGLVFGLLSNPVNYVGGGRPFLNSIKTGIDSPDLVWETGYGYAKPTGHSSVLWETLEGRDAGNGYMRFDLGSSHTKLGAGTIAATFAPNMMNGNYSLFSWASYSQGDNKLELQYDMKSAEAATLSKIFNKIYHQDIVLGAKTKALGITFSGQGLVNLFSESAFTSKANLAGEAKVSWAGGDALGVTGGYRFTGSGVELLYGDNDSSESDTLGSKGTQRVLLNVFAKSSDRIKAGLDSNVTLTTADLASKAAEIYAKPWIETNLDGVIAKKGSLNGYAKVKYNLKQGYSYAASSSSFIFGEAGAKLNVTDPVPGVVKGADLYCGFNNWDDYKGFTTVIAALRLARDVGAEVGVSLRTPRATDTAAMKAQNNLLGFTVGGNWKIPAPEFKTPLLHGAFVYNMDPYDPDNYANLLMTDFVPTGGQSKMDGKAQLRLFLKWDF